MYSVTVRGHVMIAHSLPRKFFGPAARMHGATFVIDAEFRAQSLDEHNVVLDIGMAMTALQEVTDSLGYRNLDDDSRFGGALTTTEFLAHWIHGEIAQRVRPKFRGALRVTLHESHVASGSYEGPV
jgi:6-pyruvoyltetrahydropterin/6-carboxytetrahydropterin synthase